MIRSTRARGRLRSDRPAIGVAAALLLSLPPSAGCGGAEPAVRQPAVAGQFYPEEKEKLRLAVEGFLADALPAPAETPLGIVCPHAGYVYSGQICADGFRRAVGHDVEVVAILGTNHTAPGLAGVALIPAGRFRTPLGDAEIDAALVEDLLRRCPDCRPDLRPHAREHSVEVQVPFVQHLFPRARLLAAVVGRPDPALCARFGSALAETLRGRKALIVASSDLSHYPAQDDARRVDAKVLAAVAALDPARLHETVEEEEAAGVRGLSTCACGEGPILALLSAVQALGATRGELVSYANSGDCLAGQPDRVVGYGAVAFYAGPAPAGPARDAAAPKPAPETAALDGAGRKALLALARRSIERYLDCGLTVFPRGDSNGLSALRGAFVTLKRRGELRGCIGHLASDTPVCRVVAGMALQAALADRRFPPVTRDELPELEIEISVLTPAKPVAGPEAIVLGRDGVVLEKGGRSAVFLPQVAPEQGWTRDEMLDHLARKAGLPASSWKEGARFSTFQAEVFAEERGAGGKGNGADRR